MCLWASGVNANIRALNGAEWVWSLQKNSTKKNNQLSCSESDLDTVSSD
jgi:hypothetical protein